MTFCSAHSTSPPPHSSRYSGALRPARYAPLVGLFLAAIFAFGCAGSSKSRKEKKRPEPGDTGLLVEEFVVEGVEAVPKRQLVNGLATRKHPYFWTKIPLVGAAPGYFNTLDWRKDLERIRTFYQSRGYYNMQITREIIDPNRDEGTVRLYLKIDEGERVQVDHIEIEGLETVDRFDGKSLRKGLPLREGRPFSEEAYVQTKSKMLERLERHGYAYADLQGRAYVYPGESKARIRFIADPGPQAEFGDIEVRGLETVPESYVRTVIPFEPGDPYSSEAVQRAQESIYRLDVFSLVSVLPAHQADDDREPGDEEADASADSSDSDAELQVVPGRKPELQEKPASEEGGAPATGISGLLDSAQQTAERRNQLSPHVPVVVRLKEARMWNFRIGAGVAAESNRQDVHAQFDVSSRNFLGGLRKMRWTTTPGYAWAPGLLFADQEQASRRGWILESELEFIQPWIQQKETNFRVQPSIERDVRVGYTLWNPAARIGVDRRLFENLTAGLGYRVSYYNFSNIDPQLTEETPLGQDFQPEFLLEFLEQTITVDYRENPLDPRQGWVAELVTQEATDYLFGGEFDYLKTFASVQGYIPFELATSWVLALKWTGGAIYNLEPPNRQGAETTTQRVPTISRFYGGGKGSVRSFGQRNLSVYKGTVPVGGLTQTEVSVEPRFELVPDLLGVGDLWAATFLDAGTVLPGQFLIDTPANSSLTLGIETPEDIATSLLYGVGAGVWWVTPIGPVRLDFAYTLNEFRVRQCRNEELVITGNEDCLPVTGANNPLEGKLRGFNFIIGIGHSF